MQQINMATMTGLHDKKRTNKCICKKLSSKLVCNLPACFYEKCEVPGFLQGNVKTVIEIVDECESSL
jgi:hypothetical protein